MGLDRALKVELESRGVIVIDRYIEAVEELYQAADCYLSGGLALLEAHDGLVFAESDPQLIDAVRRVMAGTLAHIRTWAHAENLAWPGVTGPLLGAMGMERDAGVIVAAV